MEIDGHWLKKVFSFIKMWTRPNRVVRASYSWWLGRNCLWLDLSILRHNGFWRAADEAVSKSMEACCWTKKVTASKRWSQFPATFSVSYFFHDPVSVVINGIKLIIGAWESGEHLLAAWDQVINIFPPLVVIVVCSSSRRQTSQSIEPLFCLAGAQTSRLAPLGLYLRTQLVN